VIAMNEERSQRDEQKCRCGFEPGQSRSAWK
jgi:hypothetical protein